MIQNIFPCLLSKLLDAFSYVKLGKLKKIKKIVPYTINRHLLYLYHGEINKKLLEKGIFGGNISINSCQNLSIGIGRTSYATKGYLGQIL